MMKIESKIKKRTSTMKNTQTTTECYVLYLAEKFWSNYVVSLMLVPTHENVPGNVFKWQKMSERQTNAGNLQNLTLSTCWNFFVFMSLFKSHSLNLTLSHTLSLSLDMLNNWKHFTAIALKISFCTKNVQWSMLTWNPEVSDFLTSYQAWSKSGSQNNRISFHMCTMPYCFKLGTRRLFNNYHVGKYEINWNFQY